MELDAFGMLLFFCIFGVLGGAGFGAGLRSLVTRDFTGMFFLIWGAGFAGIPLVIGAITFLSQGQAIYFFAQLFVVLAAIVTVALLPRDVLSSAAQIKGAEVGALAGAALAMVGGALVVLNLHAGFNIVFLFGGVLALAGALIWLRSLFQVVRALQKDA